MARFVEVARNRGVDSWKPGQEWMMVPQGGSNLVCLEGAEGYTVQEKKGKQKLDIKKLNSSDAHSAVGSDYGRIKASSQVYRITEVDPISWTKKRPFLDGAAG